MSEPTRTNAAREGSAPQTGDDSPADVLALVEELQDRAARLRRRYAALALTVEEVGQAHAARDWELANHPRARGDTLAHGGEDDDRGRAWLDVDDDAPGYDTDTSEFPSVGRSDGSERPDPTAGRRGERRSRPRGRLFRRGVA